VNPLEIIKNHRKSRGIKIKNLEQRIDQAREAIEKSDYLLIGGGAGLSAAAGLDYSGKRFTDNFADFIEKYGITDMYPGSFHPFETEAESWAHWARHIDVNRYAMPATRLYQEIFVLAQAKTISFFPPMSKASL